MPEKGHATGLSKEGGFAGGAGGRRSSRGDLAGPAPAADDGSTGELGVGPGVGGRDLAGSRASRRSRRRGGVAWRGVEAVLARAAMARRGRGARALQRGELLSLAM